MNKIRKLTRKAAKEYEAKLKEGHVDPWINPINWVLADLRLRALLYMKLTPTYFHNRHRYSPSDRRLLDHLMIGTYKGRQGVDYRGKGDVVNDIRYKYLKFKYRSEFNKTIEWIRVTSSAEKNQVYVWHEDLEVYESQKYAQ